MLILGIETSCDETAVGVIDARPLKILANVLSSQVPLHAPYSGVVPELASRAHLEKIAGVLRWACEKAGLKYEMASLRRRIAAVAFTQGPGLKGALLVGESAGRSLALALGRPVIGVHHLEAHLATILFEHPNLKPPFLGLIVSGGHTDLVQVRQWGSYNVLGRTRDDACGEALDKFAKMLALGYPGGPIVDSLARSHNAHFTAFPRPTLNGTWDFSFSGLKTSALYWLRDHGRPRGAKALGDLAASFQEAICETLVIKAGRAAKRFKLDRIVVSGGVAANSRLRCLFEAASAREGWKAYFPSPGLCTDNGAMIALAAALRLRSGRSGQALRLKRRKNNFYSGATVDSSLPFPRWPARGL